MATHGAGKEYSLSATLFLQPTYKDGKIETYAKIVFIIIRVELFSFFVIFENGHIAEILLIFRF